MDKLIALLFLGLNLSAAPITYSLTGNMSDGTTFSGYFVLDGLTETISDYSVQTQANGSFISMRYSPSQPGAAAGIGRDPDAPGEFLVFFRFEENDPFEAGNFGVWFSGTPVSFSGGSVLFYPTSCSPLACGPSLEIQWVSGTSPMRFINSGSAEQVPEPATGILIGTGLLAVALLSRSLRTPRGPKA